MIDEVIVPVEVLETVEPTVEAPTEEVVESTETPAE